MHLLKRKFLQVGSEEHLSYYSVFDGHAGTDAACYAASHLHELLIASQHYPEDPEQVAIFPVKLEFELMICGSGIHRRLPHMRCGLHIEQQEKWLNSSLCSHQRRHHIHCLVGGQHCHPRPGRCDGQGDGLAQTRPTGRASTGGGVGWYRDPLGSLESEWPTGGEQSPGFHIQYMVMMVILSPDDPLDS